VSLCSCRGRTERHREREREKLKTGAAKECTHQSKLAEKAIYSRGLVATELLNLAEVTKLYLPGMP
jgi:hypothetical protein